MIFCLLRNVNMSGFNLQFKSRAGISSTCTYIIHITEAKFQTSMEFIDEKNHFFLHGCRAGTPVGGGLVITSLLQVTNFTSLDIHFSPPSSSSLSYSIIQFAQKINLSENQYTLFHLNPIKLLLGSLDWKRLTSRFGESLSWGRAQEPSCQEITSSSLEHWLVIGSSAFIFYPIIITRYIRNYIISVSTNTVQTSAPNFMFTTKAIRGLVFIAFLSESPMQ